MDTSTEPQGRQQAACEKPETVTPSALRCPNTGTDQCDTGLGCPAC